MYVCRVNSNKQFKNLRNMITRNTMRADGKTVGQAMDEDAAFLRSMGLDAKDGKPTFDEQEEEFISQTRDKVLEALDDSVKNGKGWNDGDLPELFKAIDKIAQRNFLNQQFSHLQKSKS